MRRSAACRYRTRAPACGEIEVTSYAELVLAPQAADVTHPAFSKLFIETEHSPASRRHIGDAAAASRHGAEVWAAHLAVVDSGPWASASWKPTGRGSSVAAAVYERRSR